MQLLKSLLRPLFASELALKDEFIETWREKNTQKACQIAALEAQVLRLEAQLEDMRGERDLFREDIRLVTGLRQRESAQPPFQAPAENADHTVNHLMTRSGPRAKMAAAQQALHEQYIEHDKETLAAAIAALEQKVN